MAPPPLAARLRQTVRESAAVAVAAEARTLEVGARLLLPPPGIAVASAWGCMVVAGGKVRRGRAGNAAGGMAAGGTAEAHDVVLVAKTGRRRALRLRCATSCACTEAPAGWLVWLRRAQRRLQGGGPGARRV